MATEPYSCFAIAAPGLEPIVARELAAFGERPRIEDGGVAWEGDARSIMRANLWLRTASRVLVRVARFRAAAFFELEKRARKIPWEQYVMPDRAVDFRVTARKSRLFHSDAVAERLDKAVAYRLKSAPACGPPAVIGQLFVVRIVRDVCEISADTSGELLHRRGYRQAIAKAPLRETLAAALLLASGWTGAQPLVDPFCGSGTIPIEGALLARRIAPGLHRRFAFMDWPHFDASQWRMLTDEARANAAPTASVRILGSDRDAGAIESATANAARAEVGDDVELSVCAISAIELPRETGLIATNPPYGVRAKGGSPLRNLYAQLGHVLRDRASGWRLSMLSFDPRVTKSMGMPLAEVLRTSNGGIRVAVMLGTVEAAAMA